MASSDISRLLEEGRRALIEGDGDAFGDVLSRLGEHANQMADASAEVLRARLLYMAERYDEALDACRRVLSRDAREAAAHEIRAQIFFFRNELHEARESALKALEADPLGELAQTLLDHVERRIVRNRNPGG